jgi:hypothetical protein
MSILQILLLYRVQLLHVVGNNFQSVLLSLSSSVDDWFLFSCLKQFCRLVLVFVPEVVRRLVLVFLTIIDAVDNAPASELEPEDKPQEVESKPSEICDSSGRPLFGGLRALKATTTTTSRGSSSHQDGDKAPSTENDSVQEKRVSSHLRDLVTKHEQTSR